MRKIGIVAIMGLCFVAGIAFVYSCGGGASSSAVTLTELENRVLVLEGKLTPAYDSGWLDIAQPGELVLTHNLSGNLDDYLIDVSQRSSGLPDYIHKWYPGDLMRGVSWKFIPADFCPACPPTITITRGVNNGYGDKVRVRIWDLGS